MNKHSWALRRYLWEVRRWLSCPRKMKRGILQEIAETLSDYLQENPDATYAQLVEGFGAPAHIAASYVEAVEPEKTMRSMRRKRTIVKIVAGLAIVVVAFGAGHYAAGLEHEYKSANGYLVVDEIIEIERIEYTTATENTEATESTEIVEYEEGETTK